MFVAQKMRAKMMYATITAVPAVLRVALRRMAMYGCPVGDAMASVMSPALKSMTRSIRKLRLKFTAAAPTIQRGSHLAASSSSSAMWQMLSALVRLVTGAMIPKASQPRYRYMT